MKGLPKGYGFYVSQSFSFDEAAILSCGLVLIVPSARFDAYFGFALGSPSKEIRCGKSFALFLNKSASFK